MNVPIYLLALHVYGPRFTTPLFECSFAFGGNAGFNLLFDWEKFSLQIQIKIQPWWQSGLGHYNNVQTQLSHETPGSNLAWGYL